LHAKDVRIVGSDVEEKFFVPDWRKTIVDDASCLLGRGSDYKETTERIGSGDGVHLGNVPGGVHADAELHVK
jgi:hypothetical protein